MHTTLGKGISRLAALILIIACTACGGGGTSTSQPIPAPPPSTGDFSVSLTTASLTASPGSHAGSFTVVITPTGGFNKAITFTIGIPAGVSCLPGCTQAIPVTSSENFDLSVANTVALGNYTIPVTVSGGGQSHSVNLGLLVQPAPPVLPNRSFFIRTDDSPSDIALDRVRQLAYSANRRLNRIEVISLTTGTIVSTISIPKPVGLDITPDNNSLYVAVEAQWLYRVDLNLKQVVERIPYSPSGILGAPFTDQPITLANGKVLVRTGCGRINPCTTETDLVEYDPATHTFTALNPPNISELVGGLVRTPDHSKVLISSSDSGGHLVLFDSVTDSFIAHDNGSFFGNFVFGMAANPAGTQFAVTLDCCQLAILDANLNQIFTATNQSGFIEENLLYSLDGSRLYLPSDDTSTRSPVIRVLETNTFTDVGQVPDLKLDGFPIRPTIRALTDDGFLLGSAERGMSLVDANAQVAQLPARAPTRGSLQPSHVNSGSRNTSMTAGSIEFTPQVFFGNQLATSTTFISETQVNLTAPASTTRGTVNVKSLFPGGFFTIAPDGYTYGPQALYVTPDSGSTQGGVPTKILGYGLTYNPSQISVTVNGLPATGITVSGTLGRSPFSFPVQEITFLSPAVSLAGDTTIVVTTPDGSTSIPYHYVTHTSLPITNAVQMVVDDARNRLYSSDSVNNSIDMLNLNTGILSLVPLGARPLGLAMMPDGSRLLTANFDQKTVSIVDPDNTASVVSVNVDTGDTFHNPQPLAVAGISGNKAFVAMDSVTILGCVGVLLQIDLTTHTFVTRTPPPAPCVSNDFFLVASGDGTRAYISSFLWDGASDSFSVPNQTVVPGNTVRAASQNGNVLVSSRALYDNHLNLSYVADWPDLLECLVCGIAGEKLHSSGSLLYVAFTEQAATTPDHLEIFDVHQGTLLRTIDISEKWGAALDVLAVDKLGTRIFGLTKAGVIEIQLASLPLSLGQVIPAASVVGTSITLNGSGFAPGSSVTIGGKPATSTFLDANTIQSIVPALAPGTYSIAISSPNSESYSLDAAFVVN